MGTRKFVEESVRKKVMSWVQEIEHLSLIAIVHPHTAYATFTHGLSSSGHTWLGQYLTLETFSNTGRVNQASLPNFPNRTK